MAPHTAPLRFRGDGTLTLLQVADTHLTPLPAHDTLKLLERALDRQWPDLVVFTGDQLKGESPLFHRPDRRAQVWRTLDFLLAPLERRQVPFLVTFGDHDRKLGVPLHRQLEAYQSHPLCLNGSSPTPGAAVLPVLGSTGVRPAFALYLFAAHGDKSGHLPVSEAQLHWFRERRDALARANGGAPLPALAFQHMATEEYRLVLSAAKPGTPGAVPVRRGPADGYFTLPPRRSRSVEYLLESPSCPTYNSGQLAALRERGDVLGLYCGHDHGNAFLRRLHGIDLGCTPCCGFQAYGPGARRGVRAFRIQERDPGRYQTRVFTYEDLVDRHGPQPVLDYLYRRLNLPRLRRQ